jgi:hypothetical protein
MAEQLFKLSPDRDLQCYFLMPSAIAAMSQASSSGFTLSGKWRQQFDWAVVEWNRDNTFEHPALRNLPDGDLSGLTLTYTEQRIGCIPIESNLFPVVDWDKLRIWVSNPDGAETIYYVPIYPQHATAIGDYVPASATMTLVASPGADMRAGLALLENHYYYAVQAGDSLVDIAAGIALNIQQLSPTFSATSNGASVTITWDPKSADASYTNLRGANGNRIGVYGFAEGGRQIWQQPAVTFSGGKFPESYQISINLGNMTGWTSAQDTDVTHLQPIVATNIRKIRWTWSADLQPGSFEQTEFQVVISNWTVSGNGRQYFVAGPGSRRIQDTDSSIQYSGSWILSSGNYSGSRIHQSSQQNDTVTVTYSEPAQHQLYLGSRLLSPAASIRITVDGGTAKTFNLNVPGEDALVRLPLGIFGSGPHTVVATNLTGAAFYFDFLEIAHPSADLPEFIPQTQLALATDWDTYHSQSLPAERTAWLINKLGFKGRVNHYVGALWFYELVRTGTQYASLTVTLTAQASPSDKTVLLDIGQAGTLPTTIKHLILPFDTDATVTQALACLINIGSNAVWANANGNQLTITARSMGTQGNNIAASLNPNSQGYNLSAPGTTLSGGIDGAPYDLDDSSPSQKLMAAADRWRTDLTATPRLNRAARDWHKAFFTALKGYGIDAVASFSTELMNGDPSQSVGIAQRYWDGTPVILDTPAIQTNFSPTSLMFWIQVYLDMAAIQNQAGLVPYLQAGEVQWWYFPKAGVGMPFYDDHTKQQFQAQYGTSMQEIPDNTVDLSEYPNEIAFLPTQIANYTAAIRNALRSQFPNARFEVLYPTDTNDTNLNQIINFPAPDWTPANLNCLKTESFTFTANRDLDKSFYSMGVSAAKGFPQNQQSHLVGISDAWTAWMKEVDLAQSQGIDSVVLFALDQYCLIGYPAPPFVKSNRSLRQG